MVDRGFPRNPMPAEDVDWIMASDAEKPALIIKALLARKPDFFKNLRSGLQTLPSEQAKLDLAKAALETCKKLEIYDIYNTMLYFWMSVSYGIYFHEDIRWGYNLAMMRDFSIPAPERMQKLYKQCLDVYEKAYIAKGDEIEFFEKAEIRFTKIDIIASLPMQINNPVKVAEGWCRILWPEFIDIMPQHYFQLMAMPMQSFCEKHGLGVWELALCLGAAPAIGCFFTDDPRYSGLRAMLLDKTGQQGRDKALNMLIALQNWINSLD